MFIRLLNRQLNHFKRICLVNGLISLPLVMLAFVQALLVSRIITSVFIDQADLKSIALSIVCLSIVLLLRPILSYILERYNRSNTTQAKIKLRTALLDETRHDYLNDQNEHSKLLTLMTDGVEATDGYFSEFLPHLFFLSINTLVLLIGAFTLDYVTGLLFLITAPLIPIFMILIGKTVEIKNNQHWRQLKQLNGHLLDLLKGMTTLRVFGKEEKQSENVWKISENYRHRTLSLMKWTFLSALALELTATLSTALIAVSLGVRLLSGKIVLYPALALLILAPEFFLPMRQMGLKFHSALNAKTFANDFEAFINQRAKIPNQTHNMAVEGEFDGVSNDLLQLNEISFSYNNELLFDRVSYTFSMGLINGIIGPSGSGKTTLCKLILGDLKIQSGQLLFNNEDASAWDDADLVSHFSYVPQTAQIVEGSLLDNLLLGSEKNNQFDFYLELTGIDKWIESLEEGLYTDISPTKRQISGGERQLISLTRACLKSSEIIILDEPTSALDTTNELILLSALKRISYFKTIILTTHSSRVASICDRLIDLGGKNE